MDEGCLRARANWFFRTAQDCYLVCIRLTYLLLDAVERSNPRTAQPEEKLLLLHSLASNREGGGLGTVARSGIAQKWH